MRAKVINIWVLDHILTTKIFKNWVFNHILSEKVVLVEISMYFDRKIRSKTREWGMGKKKKNQQEPTNSIGSKWK